MRNLNLFAFCLALVCNMPEGYAQTAEQAAREDFYNYADRFANVFVGRIPNSYPSTFTGTYFMESPTFVEGSLSYNGRHYNRVLLNINAHKDLLYCLFPEGGYAIILDANLVEDLVIGGERFVYYAANRQAKLAAGYYALLHDGSVRLLKHTKQQYIENADIHRLVLDKKFDAIVRYYLIKDGQLYTITGRSSLLSALSERRRELSRWTPPVDFREDPTAAYKSYVSYYESLIK